MNIEEIISEGLNIHYSTISNEQKKKRIKDVLNKVGLDYSKSINK